MRTATGCARAILDAASRTIAVDARRRMRAAITARGLGALLARVEQAITHPSDWPAREGAAEEDVSRWWTHVVSLHRKSRTLHKELKDAELALGSEPSEENLAWLRDIQARLAALDGTEALIDGFGALSGTAGADVSRGMVPDRIRDSAHRVGGLIPTCVRLCA